MSHPDQGSAAGFGERGQAPLEDIPTDTEGFLRWASKLDRHHPYKYELSGGKVSRMMIQVSRAHWRVTANTLRELLQKPDSARFEAGPAEFGVRTGIGVRYPDVQTYLICSQDEPRAWVWARQGDGSWPRRPVELVGREDTIALGGLGVDISMADIFRGIPDAPTVE